MSVESEARDLDATVLIVNYRTPELVERCVSSVRDTAGALRLEIVVVDNGSGDESVERLRASLPAARVIAARENRGFAAGVNLGFEQTDAELVFVLNPDTELASGALQALLTRMRAHPRTGLVAPLLETADGQPQPSGYRCFPSLLTLCVDMCVPISYALSYMPVRHPHVLSPAALAVGGPVVHVTGAAMLIRREAYCDAGPLDEDFFMYLEETEWQQRLARGGWAIEIEPSALVCHLIRGGGEEAHAPPMYGVKSALRYLRMRGVSSLLSRTMLALSFISSWLTLRLIACVPSKRTRATAQARAYRGLLRALR